MFQEHTHANVAGAGGGGDGGGCGNGLERDNNYISSSPGQPSSNLFERVRGSTPPPFLSKLYAIVNDPDTNSMISWSPSGTSFIVWDHLQFSAKLLPSHFKHSNFSSFMYQLNNYGFRKIGVDYQWEYEHPYFQAGKEYMLMNIKRRNQLIQTGATVTRRGPKRTLPSTDDSIAIKLETLRNEINEMKLETQRLKKQQDEIELHIMASHSCSGNTDHDTIAPKFMMQVFVKACQEIAAQQTREETVKKTVGEENVKKRKLIIIPDSSMEHPDMDKTIEAPKHMDEKFGAEMMIPPSGSQPGSDELESRFQPDQAPNESYKEVEEGRGNSGDYTYWERIIMSEEEEDDDVNEGVGENCEDGMWKRKQQADIGAEMESLLSKLPPNQGPE